jgi:hypothetical protein
VEMCTSLKQAGSLKVLRILGHTKIISALRIFGRREDLIRKLNIAVLSTDRFALLL